MRTNPMGRWRATAAGLLSLTLALAACGNDNRSEATPQTTLFENAEDAAPGSDMGIGDNVAGETGDRLQTESECAGPLLCIGLVTESGPVGSNFDARATWDAMQSFDGPNARIKRIETTNASNFAANLDTFASDGFDAIVTVGSALGEATAAAAQANPRISYIGVDQFHAVGTPNLAGLTFAADQAGFLAGALAARMSSTNTITAVLGSEIVLEDLAFADGFVAGANHVKPSIEARVAFYPGGLHEVGRDPGWGASTAVEAIDAGAGVIVARHDETGLAALDVAATQGILCVGADLDLSTTPSSLADCIAGTATNRTTQAVTRLLDDAIAGSMTSGPSLGSTSVAPSIDGPQIDPAIETELAGLATDLRDGTLTTGHGDS